MHLYAIDLHLDNVDLHFYVVDLRLDNVNLHLYVVDLHVYIVDLHLNDVDLSLNVYIIKWSSCPFFYGFFLPSRSIQILSSCWA